MPDIILIAAVAEENRVIGRDLDLPWHLPEDLQRFKRLTTGYPLILGRKTFQSIVHQFGGPLPNRRMIVLTRKGLENDYDGVETYSSLDAALESVDGEQTVFIGGGEDIYRQFLPHADRLELTLVEGEWKGDTYFPEYEHLIGDVFEPVEVDKRDGFRFVTYERT
ncbi:dihydrofolate reductase [Longibacter sp.]|uniref:dihydrofolate reductase n=1 Tax=Longibacter sp. TaxID=2045415 RepID=UPI003EC139C6